MTSPTPETLQALELDYNNFMERLDCGYSEGAARWMAARERSWIAQIADLESASETKWIGLSADIEKLTAERDALLVQVKTLREALKLIETLCNNSNLASIANVVTQALTATLPIEKEKTA